MGEREVPTIIMVTGGCGFIGSNFVHFLLEETKAIVVNFDNLSSAGSKPDLEVSERYTLVVGDIRETELLEKTLRLHKVKEIVHFAALTCVGDSFKSPQEYVKTNVEGTLSVLEAVKNYGHINRFLHISTDEVYGDTTDGIPKKEGDGLKPTNPYSASKFSAEKFVDVYHIAYNIPVCFVRMCNIYGPWQTSDKVIPKFIYQAIEDQPFTIEGDGSQLRNWLYVNDACKAIYSVLEEGKTGEIYNISASFELSVLELAKKIKEEVDSALGHQKDKFETTSIPDRPFNDSRYLMSSEKLRGELGWSEQTTFEVGLKSTIEWCLGNKDKQQSKEMVLVYGAGGWIGGQFTRLLQEQGVNFEAGKNRMGNDPDESIEKEILEAAPSHVVSFIGRAHGPGCNTVDYVEGGPEKLAINLRDNLFGPMLLAEICRKHNIHFTYIGSGCIFTYNEKHPIGGSPVTEDETANFFGSSYSVAKGYTDRLMSHYGNVLNLRIRLPISEEVHQRNSITKLAKYPKILSVPNSVTVLPDLLPAVLQLMKRKHVGTVNLVNHGIIEHEDILSDYIKYVDPSHTFELMRLDDSSELAKTLKKTRCNCHLDSTILSELCPQVSNAKDAVRAAIIKMAENSNS